MNYSCQEEYDQAMSEQAQEEKAQEEETKLGDEAQAEAENFIKEIKSKNLII